MNVCVLKVLSNRTSWRLLCWASTAYMISWGRKLTFLTRTLNPVSSLWFLVLFLLSIIWDKSLKFLYRCLPHSHVHPLSQDFIQMAQNFDDCRRKWLGSEYELGSCKEVLTKTETERGALEVKLKHARNQIDVEIRRRQKAEADCEKLVCWIKCWPFVCWCVLSWSTVIFQGVSHLCSACVSVIQDRQIQLIRDLLTSEGSSNSIKLSAEQRSALAFLNTNCQAAVSLNTSRR